MDFEKDKRVVNEIASAVNAYGGRTFYVGGYVRDKILGKENKDLDIEIHNIEPGELREILSQVGTIDERKVGDNFGIFALKGYDVDIALPRAEKPLGNGGHKDFIIDVDPYIGFEAACRRRDFTMNAMMQDVLTGEIIDPFGGLNDIKRKQIKHVDKDTFADDPLRVFRAAQFASRFNFSISGPTVVLSSSMDLSKLSHERVAAELDKALLKAEKPSVFFNELRRMDQLKSWFPEVYELIGCIQEPSHHPEGDVYTHTMLVLDEAAKVKSRADRPRDFMVASLCHDFGKPLVTEYNAEKRKVTAYSHDIEGVALADAFVRRIYNDNELGKYVRNLTEYHMKPNMYLKAGSVDKKYMHLFDESVSPNDLILLSRCDHMGRGMEINYECEEAMLFEKFGKYKCLMQQPHVTGKDLLKLGYTPSPKFTEMLKFTHDCHLAGLDRELQIKNMMGQFGRPQGTNISRYMCGQNDIGSSKQSENGRSIV